MKSSFLIFLIPGVLCVDWPPNGRLVDLSRPYDDKTIFWPGGEPFGFSRVQAEYKKPENYWYAANDFKTAEHCGTHLDAPYHFNKNGWKVGDIPLERLIVTGVLVNASRETNGNRSYELPVEQLVKWEEDNGPIPSNSVALVTFGWADRYPNRNDYLGEDKHGKLAFPGISQEAAQWLVDTKKVVGIGVDTASVDPSMKTHVHIIASSAGLYNLENVAITEPLPPTFKLIVLPMKIAKGTGAPCRIVAVI